MSLSNTMTLELVRLMWDEGKAHVDAQKSKGPMTNQRYFELLEEVVKGIRAHLDRHGIHGIVECLVKFGEGSVVVLVDFSNMTLTPDLQDPSVPVFHIPCVRKAANA